MTQRVPVADDLLTTKLKGHSVKRLAEAVGIPLIPGMVAMLLNMPSRIVLPLGIVGLILGGAVYLRTPSTQNPRRWLLGLLRLKVIGGEYSWQPPETETETVEYENYMESTDEHHTTEEEQSAEQTPFERLKERLLGSDNTVDHLDFEYIRDDGVIVCEDGYSKIIEIEPRPWLILDGDQRAAVLDKWRDVLKGTKYPFQIHQVPVPYRADEYFDLLEGNDATRSPDEHPLISHGRREHQQWLSGVVDMANIRDRRHFITVHVDEDSMRPESEGGNPITDFLDNLRGGEEEEIDEDDFIDEVNSRASSIKQSLPPTGVDPEVIDSGERVKEILYFYYQGEFPNVDLDHGWISQPASPDEVEYGQAEKPRTNEQIRME